MSASLSLGIGQASFSQGTAEAGLGGGDQLGHVVGRGVAVVDPPRGAGDQTGRCFDVRDPLLVAHVALGDERGVGAGQDGVPHAAAPGGGFLGAVQRQHAGLLLPRTNLAGFLGALAFEPLLLGGLLAGVVLCSAPAVGAVFAGEPAGVSGAFVGALAGQVSVRAVPAGIGDGPDRLDCHGRWAPSSRPGWAVTR